MTSMRAHPRKSAPLPNYPRLLGTGIVLGAMLVGPAASRIRCCATATRGFWIRVPTFLLRNLSNAPNDPLGCCHCIAALLNLRGVETTDDQLRSRGTGRDDSRPTVSARCISRDKLHHRARRC